MSLKQHEEYCESLAEARAEAAYFRAKADEFLTDLVPQLPTPVLEYFVAQLEAELRERDDLRNRSFGVPF